MQAKLEKFGLTVGKGLGRLLRYRAPHRPETQQMLDFCAEHSIVSDIELIPPTQINQAYDRVLRSDVKYRFVIDMTTL